MRFIRRECCFEADETKTVSAFIAKLPSPQREIALALRKIVRAAEPAVEEKLAWGMPWFAHNGLLCYILPCKNHVTFGFPKGKFLKDSKHLLEGSGKGMRHVKLRTRSDIQVAQFKRWVKAASAMNKKE